MSDVVHFYTSRRYGTKDNYRVLCDTKIWATDTREIKTPSLLAYKPNEITCVECLNILILRKLKEVVMLQRRRNDVE